MRISNKLLLLFFLAFTFIVFNSCKPKKEIVYKEFPKVTDEKPKNIILLIGDGMGLAQINAAIIEQKDRLNIQSAHYIGFSDVRSYDNLITDSGAGATALSIGKKTYNGAIGVDGDTIPRETILEKAASLNMGTGIVASCGLTHATPASFYAHQPSRKMDSAIASNFYGKNITVAAGGGLPYFDIKRLISEGYTVTENYKQLPENHDGKIVAFYGKDNHPPKISEKRGNWLPDATKLALNVLDKNDKGFFMMIEGSQIDWGGHANDLPYVTSELMDFDKTLGIVLDYAAKNKNTLVVVTADHETGGLTLLKDDKNQNERIKPHFSTSHHSGIMVPIMAWGPGASLFSGYLDNTDIYWKMMGLFNFID
jgi:alkaline phosphatase